MPTDAVEHRPGVHAGTQGHAQHRLPGVDLLRGVACLSVYFCHVNAYWHTGESLPWPLPEFFEFGAHGVDLFIVISGFCLALPQIRSSRLEAVPLRRFAIRRATRLLPPYWVAVGVAGFFAMSPSFYGHVVAQRAGVDELLGYVLTLQLVVPHQVGTINGSLWSVALEAHLYLVFPVLIWAFAKFGARRVLPALVALSILWDVVGNVAPIAGLPYDKQLPGRLIQFAFGVGCAILVRGGIRVSRRVVVTTLVMSGTCAMAMSTLDFAVGRLSVWGLALAALVLLVAEYEPRGLLRPVGVFGVFSYSFYLLHQPALLLSSRAARGVGQNPYLLIALASTVGFGVVATVSYVFYRVIELPSHRYGRRLSTRF